MKRAILFACTFVAFAAASHAQGVLKFKSEKHEFGKVPQGKPVTYTFEFVNTGNQPVVIANAQASCGCTTPEWTKDPVLPGKTGTVKATFNAAAMGQFNKPVTVTSNAESPTIVLTLTGEVMPSNQPAATVTAAPAPVVEKKAVDKKKKS
ncbi:MAG: DUF1573 domain-containing protein [Cytophagaceae bacterium]|nr:DUF1573 domain-containing protein [Cytophagaceae bacterium]